MSAEQATSDAPLRLELSAIGRETYDNAFEAGEPVYLRALLANVAEKAIVVDLTARVGLVTASITAPDGTSTAIDFYDRLRARHEARLGGTLGTDGPVGNVRTLAPGETIDLCGLAVRWQGISSRLQCDLPAGVIARAGDYTVTLVHTPAAGAGKEPWGRAYAQSLCIRVLDDKELGRLEARLAVPRREALERARQAAAQHFGIQPAAVRVHEPIRLRLFGGVGLYDAAFVHDTGLAARWVRVRVDATTGQVTVKPFGEGA